MFYYRPGKNDDPSTKHTNPYSLLNKIADEVLTW